MHNILYMYVHLRRATSLVPVSATIRIRTFAHDPYPDKHPTCTTQSNIDQPAQQVRGRRPRDRKSGPAAVDPLLPGAPHPRNPIDKDDSTPCLDKHRISTPQRPGPFVAARETLLRQRAGVGSCETRHVNSPYPRNALYNLQANHDLAVQASPHPPPGRRLPGQGCPGTHGALGGAAFEAAGARVRRRPRLG